APGRHALRAAADHGGVRAPRRTLRDRCADAMIGSMEPTAPPDRPPHLRGWLLAMRWHDLLFAHWRVAPAALRPLLPRGLALDLHGGDAWLGLVPFRMSGVRARCTPRLPRLSAFPECNLRTYVIHAGRPGVWFFSLDAA